VDGLSTDESLDVIRQNEDIITYWVSESDRGIYDAFNKAIGYSKGEDIMFLNSGDVLLEPDSISKLYSKITTNDHIVIWDIYSRKGVWKMSKNVGSQLVNKFLGHTGTAVFKRSLFEELGMYDTSFRLLGDREFYYRVLKSKGNRAFRKITGLYSEFENDGGPETNLFRSSRGPEEKAIIHARYEDLVRRYSYNSFERIYYKSRKTFDRLIDKLQLPSLNPAH
jgi:glycosyltransferase involved in cell wall biosynthesis